MVEFRALSALFEVAQPKYARLVRAVQERIENGAYPVGSLLPAEAGFAKEFGCSRPSVVASPRVRDMLNFGDETAVLEPVELASTYLPLRVAEGTHLGSEALVPGGGRAGNGARKSRARDLDRCDGFGREFGPCDREYASARSS